MKITVNKQRDEKLKNKKYNVEETNSSANRCSRLSDIVGEISEVTQLLCIVVKQ